MRKLMMLAASLTMVVAAVACSVETAHAKKPDNPQMEETIRSKLVDGKLACRDAWAIAKQYRGSKMAVSGACESFGIKIKPCQLGAF